MTDKLTLRGYVTHIQHNLHTAEPGEVFEATLTVRLSGKFTEDDLDRLITSSDGIALVVDGEEMGGKSNG